MKKKSLKVIRQNGVSISKLLLISLLLTPLAAFAENHKYMGTGSCSSSNCHGNVNPLKATSVLQNEYHTWTKYDKHSQSYLILENEDSRRIASLMGLSDASKEPLCLKCHATYVPDESLRGAKYQLEDGVSCESCHGAAEKWLETHSVKGTSHKDNLEQGLQDLIPLTKRAELCLSCHYGTEDKTVNHVLYGAGHPRLAFELDTFGILQPRHWEIDQDYKDRKQEYVPAKAWLVGQAVLGREIVEAISSGKRSKYGTFPELSLFDCFSCHHSLTEDQWKQRTYEKRPGELRLNLAPLIMVREGMATINPTLSKELDAGIKELHDSYIKDGAPKGVANLKSIFTKVIAASESVTADTKTLGAILKSLISFGARTPYLKYELAEQLGMGAQAILASSPELGKAHKAGIDKIFATLNSSEAFAPDAFTEACKEFMKTL